jgi:hypothetical protein
MLSKLNDFVCLTDASILVLFNLEFVDVLIKYFGVNPQNITFLADDALEADAARKWYGVTCPIDIINYDTKRKEIFMPNIKNKFDVVVMNPPYQNSENKRTPLWKKFVENSMQIIKDGGYLSAVHPCSWRKPNADLYSVFTDNNLQFLSIHNQKDGQRIFGAGTRFDWYIMQKSHNSEETVVVDEKGKTFKINLKKYPYLPHGCLDIFERIFAKTSDNKCSVFYTCSYHTQREYMSEEKTKNHIYPCIHATSKSGPKIWWSPVKNELFGIKKVIFGSASPQNAFFDSDGGYATTQHCFSIPVSSDQDGNDLVSFAKTDDFANIINMTKFAGFETDHELFTYFRKDFWKEFI